MFSIVVMILIIRIITKAQQTNISTGEKKSIRIISKNGQCAALFLGLENS